jgi:hypothetical protein
MYQESKPSQVLDDLSKFISTYYRKHLPHPLLIAQAFCLQFQEYGKTYSLSAITDAIEQLVKNNIS